MTDVKVNGQYLEEGIYFEAIPLLPFHIGNTYLSYLVYRNGLGDAWVIRGGTTFDPTEENFAELIINSCVDISTTKDSYSESPAIEDRIITKLDLNVQEPTEVWTRAVSIANNIDSKIDYELNPLVSTMELLIQIGRAHV